jgi:hypothetical protein
LVYILADFGANLLIWVVISTLIYASKKDKLISEIMEASQDDSKTFHKLLRMQRSNSAINTDTLVIDNVEYNQNNIMEAWRIHFENLATPNLDENKFDLEPTYRFECL